MKLLSTSGHDLAHGTVCMAEFKNSDGSLTLYSRSASDIGLLIERLKSEGCTDSELLDPNFWLAEECNRVGGSHCQDGTCAGGGRCQATSTGGGTYCRCR